MWIFLSDRVGHCPSQERAAVERALQVSGFKDKVKARAAKPRPGRVVGYPLVPGAFWWMINI